MPLAEDLTQEVMLSIWRRAHQFDRSRAALSTWVYTIARNRRIDALRRERRPDFDPEDPALVGDNELAPRGDRYAEAAQARREVMRAVERCRWSRLSSCESSISRRSRTASSPRSSACRSAR